MDPQRLLPISIIALAALGLGLWSYNQGGVRHRATLDALSRPLLDSPTGTYVAGRAVTETGWRVEIQGRGLDRWALELPADDDLYWDWGPGDRLFTFDPVTAAMTVHSFDGTGWTSSPWTLELGSEEQSRWFCGIAKEPPQDAVVPPPEMFPLVLTQAERDLIGQDLGEPCPLLGWTWK